MRKNPAIALIVFFVILQFVVPVNAFAADWPMFRLDTMHTGRASIDGPARGVVQWSIQTDGTGSPIIAENRIYIMGSRLEAYTSAGELLWFYPCVGINGAAPAVGSDGTIYAPSADGFLYAITPTGTLKWKRIYDGRVSTSLTIGVDGTIYIGTETGKLKAFRPDGATKFTYTAGGAIASTPAVASDGTIYFGCDDGSLYALTSTGTLKWKFSTHPSSAFKASPSIASDGTIYIGSSAGYLYAVWPTGNQRWRFAAGSAIVSSTAIAENGMIVVGCRDKYIYCVNPNGTLNWKYQTGNYVDSSPAIDHSGVTYVGSNDGSVYAINPDGSLYWVSQIGVGVSSSPAIGDSSILYVTTLDGLLCSLGSDSTPPLVPIVTDGGVFSFLANTLSASWISSDPESGIIRYEYAIGTSPGASDVIPFTDAGLAVSIMLNNLALVHGNSYYFTVRATNGADLVSDIGVSDGIRIDLTPPLTPVVADDGIYTASGDTLHAIYSSADPESGIVRYEYSVGTTPGLNDVRDWQDAGLVNNLTLSGLNLANGAVYFINVRAYNGAGNSSEASSDGIKVDITSPIISGVSAQFSLDQMNLNMQAADPESGIDKAEYAILTSPDIPANPNWVQADANKQLIIPGTFVNGLTYYVIARAVNGVGVWSEITRSEAFLLDVTPPTKPVIIDDGIYTASGDTLHAIYSSADPESGIVRYEYSVGTAPGLNDVRDWQDAGLVNNLTLSGLNLANGIVYFINVRAYNGVGIVSEGVSDGIKVDLTSPEITNLSAQLSLTQMVLDIQAVDPESGIDKAEYAILTSSDIPIDPNWVTAEANKEILIPGTFLGSQIYYVVARVSNGVGAWSEIIISDAIRLDKTPPVTPVVLDDGEYWADPALIQASWTSEDPESGIDHYLYCVGLTPGVDNVVKWTVVSETSINLTGLNLINGTKYFISVFAINGVGLKSLMGFSDGITLDATPPSQPVVTDDGDYTNSINSLHASWQSTDTESGIAEYQYCIGTTPGSADIASWTSTGSLPAATAINLTLEPGIKYYFNVKAKNKAGQWSLVGTSDGIEYRAGESAWRKFRCDSMNSGCTTINTASLGQLRWRVQTKGYVESSPSISGDGTAYIGSSDGKLYAINSDGSVRWTYQTDSCIDSSPAISPDGFIYVGSYDGGLYCIYPNGDLKWRFSAGGMIWSSPAISENGTIYVGCMDSFLYAINPDGSLKWKYKSGGTIWSSPALDVDDNIYFGCGDGKFYCLSSNAAVKWTYDTGSAIDSSPCISKDGFIYFGSGDGNFYAVLPDGTLWWKRFMGSVVDSSAAILPDGNVCVGTGGAGTLGKLSMFTPDGNEVWSVALPGGVRSSPAVDANGTIFVGSSDGNLFCISKEGEILWSYKTGDSILASAGIANNGSIIIGSDDGGIYCFRDLLPTDSTPPTVPLLTVKKCIITLGSPIDVEWIATDLESGIGSYSYAIGTEIGSDNVVPWTNAGLATRMCRDDINLIPGQSYYVSVIARNNQSIDSGIGVSDPIVVVPKDLNQKIGAIKNIQENEIVNLPGKVVTAVFEDCLFVEEADRSSGIRIIASSTGLQPGAVVDVQGTIKQQNEEPVITNATFIPKGSSNSMKPLGISGKVLMGNEKCLPLGLLVRMIGQVAELGNGYFILADGANLVSAHGYNGIEVWMPSYEMPTKLSWVAVTGVLCKEVVNSELTTVIRAVPNIRLTYFEP